MGRGDIGVCTDGERVEQAWSRGSRPFVPPLFPASEHGMVQEATTSLVVANNRRWDFNPRLGAIHVYVDGSRRAVVALNQERLLVLSTGVHTVRVRHWWFMSPPRTFMMGPGSELHLEADGTGDGAIVGRLVRAAIHPLHSLSLTFDAESQGTRPDGNRP